MLLDGRYRLLQRRTKDGAAATWDGEDDQLQRPVVVHVVAGATAAEAVDAARRSAALEDERLPHLLDVGLDRAVDGTALGWVVTERCPGRSLADLLREAPLPAARARALVGEAAAVLARASRSGLHHRRLEPSCVFLTADGAVTVLGLEVASAAAGLPVSTPTTADRDDAVGLARLLYAALTGLWPAGRCGSLGAAPTGRGGAPVPPGDLASGVPADLDALCVAVLGPYDDGPRTPAEVASLLAPWGSSTGPVTRTGLGIPAAPAPRPIAVRTPARAVVPAAGGPVATAGVGAWVSAPARARLGGGPGLHFADAPGSATDEPGSATAERQSSEVQVDPGGTRVLRRPTVAVPAGSRTLAPLQEAPAHPTRASRRAAQRRAERQAAGSAEAFDALLGPVTGSRGAVASAAAAPAHPSPAQRPASTFDDTDTTDWVSAGWGPAPAGAQPLARSARREPSAPSRGSSSRRTESRRTESRRTESRRWATVVLAVVVLLLVGLVVLVTTHLSQLGGVLGIAPSGTTRPPGTVAGSDAAPQGGGAAAIEEAASTDGGAAGPAEVSQAAALDPFGDGTENDGGAARAVDGDDATAWTSSTYTTPALGGLKRGVGLSLVLGDGTSPTSISTFSLTTQGSGGRVEVRSSTDGGYDGSTVVATSTAGTGGSPREISFEAPVTANHLVLWFTELPQTAGGYSAVVDEVSAR